MYDVNGDFGQVRSICAPIGAQNRQKPDVPFQLSSAGWHCCNALYRIQRENGQNGHLLLFSLSDGGMLQLSDRPPVQLPASSVAWIPPRCRHAYYTSPGKLWEFYWLDVSEESSVRFQDLFDEQSILPMTGMDEITRGIEEILRSRTENKMTMQIEYSRVTGNIYHKILEESLLQRQAGKQDELVQKIIRSMESCCEQEWNLSEISKQYYISVPQLIRRFKAETGITPYAYLMTLRLQTAEIYLKYSNQTVEEISRRTGFSSTSNFIQQFRKTYEMTPAKYRSRKQAI